MHWWYNNKNSQGKSAHTILLEWFAVNKHATNVVLKDNQAQFKYDEQVLNDMVDYLGFNGIKTNKTALYNKVRLMCVDYTLAWAVQERRQAYDLNLAEDETIEDRVNLLCRDYYILEDIFHPSQEKQPHPLKTLGRLEDTDIKPVLKPLEPKPKAKVPKNMSTMYALLKQARVFYDQGIFEKGEFDSKRLLILDKYI